MIFLLHASQNKALDLFLTKFFIVIVKIPMRIYTKRLIYLSNDNCTLMCNPYTIKFKSS